MDHFQLKDATRLLTAIDVVYRHLNVIPVPRMHNDYPENGSVNVRCAYQLIRKELGNKIVDIVYRVHVRPWEQIVERRGIDFGAYAKDVPGFRLTSYEIGQIERSLNCVIQNRVHSEVTKAVSLITSRVVRERFHVRFNKDSTLSEYVCASAIYLMLHCIAIWNVNGEAIQKLTRKASNAKDKEKPLLPPPSK